MFGILMASAAAVLLMLLLNPYATITLAVLGGFALLVLIPLIAFAVMRLKLGNASLELAHDIRLGPQWVALVPPSKLPFDHVYQYVLIDIPPDAKVDTDDRGMVQVHFSDGTAARPEVEAFDDQGTARALAIERNFAFGPSADSWGDQRAGFGFSQITRGHAYRGVRIRSPRAFTAPKVTWYSRDPK